MHSLTMDYDFMKCNTDVEVFAFSELMLLVCGKDSNVFEYFSTRFKIENIHVFVTFLFASHTRQVKKKDKRTSLLSSLII